MDGDIFSNQFFGVEIIKFVVDCLLFSFKHHNYTLFWLLNSLSEWNFQ